jgi:chondroitin 4-sulfotransferase 11
MRGHRLKINGKKLLFIHIPKTAGTSIVGSLIDQSNYKNKSHVLASYYSDEEWLSSFSFVVIRNPFERFISHWLYHTTNYDGLMFSKRGFKIKNISLLEYYHLSKYLDDFKSNWKTMCQYITHPTGKPVDLIIRFENLECGWRSLCNEIGIDKSLIKLNSTSHMYYRNYYDEKSKEAIGNWYDIDLKTFGYEF